MTTLDIEHGALTPDMLNVVAKAMCARSSTDRASDYGSEGWGFESLRACEFLLLLAKESSAVAKAGNSVGHEATIKGKRTCAKVSLNVGGGI
jgi:hypothetical protein